MVIEWPVTFLRRRAFAMGNGDVVDGHAGNGQMGNGHVDLHLFSLI
jgi:hypothetical protein